MMEHQISKKHNLNYTPHSIVIFILCIIFGCASYFLQKYVLSIVASLLSSLHQLKEENLDLEDSVDHMVQRRDHLLAVRARLLALSNISVATSGNSANQTGGNDCSTS